MKTAEERIENKAQEALSKYFEVSETVTSQHILYKDFVEQWGSIVNKFQMYLLFIEGWGNPIFKDGNGNLGYKMSVKLNLNKQ